MVDYTKPIAESNSFIVLDKYAKEWQGDESYQSKGDLEQEFIEDLQNQSDVSAPSLNTPEKLLANVREQLQTLNKWQRFVETYLGRPSDSSVDKTHKIHDDYIHDFVFDDGQIQNIYLLDKKNIARNKVQVIKEFEQTGSHANRNEVTILINGLPMVQVALKKRGIAILEAFNQVHRYSVSILDKFDALTNSISEGLPREITLRQKQYKDYRDLLLNFLKPDAEVAA